MPTTSRGLVRWLLYGGAALEDFADRLNHVWTFSLLLVLGAVISWKQGYSSPISCWCPAEMTTDQVAHMNAACWNSYYITYPEDIDEYDRTAGSTRITAEYPCVTNSFDEEDESERRIATTKTTYYQWIPVIVCLQALLFKLPSIVMYVLHGASGITFDRIASLTEGFHHLTLAERETMAKQLARYLYKWCKDAIPRGIPWRGLTVVWLLVKILYVVNIVCQMTFVDHFLRTRHPPFDNSTSYGGVILDNLIDNNATTWRNSPVFPRTLLCDVEIYFMHNIHRYTVQCHLTANDFNEHAYIFIWMWLFFVTVVTCISFIVWILRTVLPFFRQSYLRRFLSLADDNDAMPPYDVNRFTEFVGEDGVMVLKLVGANSSDLVTRDVIFSMWTFVTKETVPQQPILQPQQPQQPWPEVTIEASAPSDPAHTEYDPRKMKA